MYLYRINDVMYNIFKTSSEKNITNCFNLHINTKNVLK